MPLGTQDPNYFGKNAFSELKGVADAAAKVLRGETQQEEKQEKQEEVKVDKEPEPTTEQEKSDG